MLTAFHIKVIITTQGKASYEGMFVTSGVISEKRKYVESVENCCGHTVIFLLHKLSKTSK